MDDYLSKPFSKEQLYDVVDKWLESGRAVTTKPQLAVPENGQAAGIEQTKTPDNSPIDSTTLDELRALEREGSAGVLARILHLYLSDSSKLLSDLREAALTGDLKVLHQVAHTLKSSSANVGALKLSALCREVEVIGRSESTQDPVPLLHQMNLEPLVSGYKSHRVNWLELGL